MKKLKSLFILIAIVFISFHGLEAQKVVGNGPIVSEKIDMKNIHTLSLGISANVFITQGKQQTIEIKGQQNIIDLLEKKANGNTWEIKFPRNSNVNMSKSLEIHITMKDLKGLNIGGSGSIYGKNTFKNLDDVDLNIGGSGSIELSLEAEEVDANIGGSGSMKLEGSAEEINANVAGSGSIKAINFNVEEATVNNAGSGSVHIHVRDELSATIAGSGGVKYKGNPKIDTKIVGSGRVKAY